MRELAELVAARAAASGPLALATVVRVEGSAYRRPGARMLVGEAGRLAGGVSGGCIEDDVVRKALFLSEGRARVYRYDATDEEVGMGCNGVVDVLVERLVPGATDPFPFFAATLDGQGTTRIATVIAGDHLGRRWMIGPDGQERGDLDGPLRELARAALRSLEAGRVLSTGDATLSLERVDPPPRLLLFGNGPDLVPVVALSNSLGWRVWVLGDAQPETLRRRFAGASRVLPVSPTEAALRSEPDARSLAVLMTHSLERDRAILPGLLRSALPFVGVLGPRERTERVLKDLAFTAEERAKLHAPVGLDLGAEGPDEIALSIVAELQAHLRDRGGGPLRERTRPLHDP